MAQRYGGKFSPDGSPDNAGGKPTNGGFKGATRSRVGGRVNLLFFLPLLLLFRTFGNGAANMAMTLVALGMLLLAAFMTREGLLAEEAYDARKVARRPAFPRKMLGSVLTGAGLALAAFSATGEVISPAIIGIVGTVLHGMAFGLDPMRDKGMEGIDQFQTDRVARAVDEAEKHLAAMTDAIKRASDRTLETRVERFQTTARDLFRTVENDPRDLTAARKYLGVYLLGARDATVKFADIYGRSRDAKARTDYEALLDDLEKNFDSRNRKLLLDDNSDLTVEIEVLRERLQREGVRDDAL
ncbi:5-bromo-4-chloroindolyl phosphate hydrolysis family protein [Shimia biformata]|uniref:5-bromo-4-chloroindolyl phosphate hydrolysis family protein n=1 Tax=Shimia biformata TaxID=1294299 RepID=UPI00194E3D24|nr:5-bromo-4-chloroindolyl phosphate hydrolysis family protein [Shimia biformata]